MLKVFPNPFKKEITMDSYIAQSLFISTLFLSYFLFLMFHYVKTTHSLNLTVIGKSFLVCVGAGSLASLFILIILSLGVDTPMGKRDGIISLIVAFPSIFIFMLLLSLGLGPYTIISYAISNHKINNKNE